MVVTHMSINILPPSGRSELSFQEDERTTADIGFMLNPKHFSKIVKATAYIPENFLPPRLHLRENAVQQFKQDALDNIPIIGNTGQ